MVGIDAKVEVLSGWNLCMSSAHIPKEARRASWPHKALPVSKGAVNLVLCYGLLVWKVESEFFNAWGRGAVRLLYSFERHVGGISEVCDRNNGPRHYEIWEYCQSTSKVQA